MHAYRSLLGNDRFRRFWFALVLVMLADEIVRTTLVWHVYAVTRSGEAVGLLMVCLTLPIVAAGLVAGWLLDRFPRARVMAADTAGRAVVLLAVAGLVAAGVGGLAPLYGLAVIQGALLMILLGGAPAAIVELVPAEGRSAANAMEQLGFAVGGIAGPLIAGQILAQGAVPVALAVAALCYGGFALVVRGMAIGGGRVAAARVDWRASGVLHPTVAIITVMFLIFNIGTGALMVVLPVLVDRGLGAAAGGYGLLLGCLSLGGSAGALLAGAVPATAPLGRLVALGQVASGVAVLALLLPLAWPAGPLAVAAAAALLFGLCSGPLTVWAQTIRMRHIAPQWRGRAFAGLRMIMQSGRPVGGAAAGFALGLLSLGFCIAAIGAVIALPAAAALLHRAIRGAEG